MNTADVVQTKSAHGAVHSFSQEERRSFADYINQLLANEPDLKDVLPLNPKNDDLFRVVSQGLLLIKLINATKANVINEKKVIKKKNPNTFEVTANLSLAIDGCKEIGCNVVNIGPEDLQRGTPHLILGLIWQVVKIGLLSRVNLDSHPELVAMLDPNEDLRTFINVAPEVNLLRWFNFHLKRQGHPRQVRNFGGDIKDAENYLVLLNSIAPNVVPRNAYKEPNPRKRAELVCNYAAQLDCLKFVTPDDINAGNEKLNLAFTAYMFNKLPGLEVMNDDAAQKRALEEAERLMKQKFEEEERLRKERWEKEERERQEAWKKKDDEARRKWQEEEDLRRKRWLEEEAARRGALSQEQQDWRENMKREEQERAKRRFEEEEERRRKAEELRQLEVKAEEQRRMEEERRRHWETEMKRRELLLQEQEARLKDGAIRAEEERRKQFEENRRRQEEEQRRKWEEEMRRREEEEMRRQDEEEERLRKWEQEKHLMEQQERLKWEMEQQQRKQLEDQQRASEAQEAERQSAWEQYFTDQAKAQQEELARQEAWNEYYKQQSVTTQAPQRTTTTVTTTTVVSKFPILRLILTVVRGKRLIKTELIGKSDPYVVLIHNGIRQKTSVCKNTQDPVWNQDFEFRGVMEQDEIVLDVFDKELLKKDEFMGEVRLRKDDFVNGHDGWYQLQSRSHRYDRVHGELFLRFSIP